MTVPCNDVRTADGARAMRATQRQRHPS